MNFGVQSGHDITDDVTQRTREHAFVCMMGRAAQFIEFKIEIEIY